MLLRGLLIGLAIAAPVGPIDVLCNQRMLTQGRFYGCGGIWVDADLEPVGEPADAVILAFGVVALHSLLVS